LNATVDLLIHPRWLIPVEPERAVFEHHSIAVDKGRIVGILPRSEARQHYHAAETVDLPSHALIPGLVNLHVHAPMSLMRGMADDLSLEHWLHDAIWPAEARYVSADFVRDGTLLAVREMLRGGITTCNDMYFFPDAAAAAYADAGMRAVIGLIAVDFPSAWACDADDCLGKGLAVYDRWKDHPLLAFTLAPHAPYTVSNAGLKRIGTLAAELDLPIHIHVHETTGEIRAAIASSGIRPLSLLERLGLLGPGLIAVHAVHLDETDLALLARHDVSVAHCPSSNMKLASGIAPLADLLERGINVGLGTDGAASNNRLDLLQEMRQAALLAKVAKEDAAVVPAHRVLAMATLGGARALGLEERIGSIAPGKRADLCAIDLSGPLFAPCFDPVSHLVYTCGREQVSHVWVDGKLRVCDGKVLLQISDNELLALASLWQTRLASWAKYAKE
jgi:5-methylthioadenosine/S-adenosylhomocysteine deaminase